MPEYNVCDRIEEFRNEISGCREGSDLHYLLKKVAERVAKLYPGRDNCRNWNEAQDRLLLYTQTQPIRSYQSLLEYVMDVWNSLAYREGQDLDNALKLYPYLKVDRNKENRDMFIRQQEETANHIMELSDTEKRRRGLQSYILETLS